MILLSDMDKLWEQASVALSTFEFLGITEYILIAEHRGVIHHSPSPPGLLSYFSWFAPSTNVALSSRMVKPSRLNQNSLAPTFTVCFRIYAYFRIPG